MIIKEIMMIIILKYEIMIAKFPFPGSSASDDHECVSDVILEKFRAGLTAISSLFFL